MRTCMKQKTDKLSAGRALRRIAAASIIAAMPVMHAGAHRYPAPQDAIEWTKGITAMAPPVLPPTARVPTRAPDVPG